MLHFWPPENFQGPGRNPREVPKDLPWITSGALEPWAGLNKRGRVTARTANVWVGRALAVQNIHEYPTWSVDPKILKQKQMFSFPTLFILHFLPPEKLQGPGRNPWEVLENSPVDYVRGPRALGYV